MVLASDQYVLYPAVPVMAVTGLVPLPLRIPVKVVAPVPPLPTGNVPVTSEEARLMAPLTRSLFALVFTGREAVKPLILTSPTTSKA